MSSLFFFGFRGFGGGLGLLGRGDEGGVVSGDKGGVVGGDKGGVIGGEKSGGPGGKGGNKSDRIEGKGSIRIGMAATSEVWTSGCWDEGESCPAPCWSYDALRWHIFATLLFSWVWKTLGQLR